MGVFQHNPPRPEIPLSELGASLRQPLKAPGDWAIARIARIRAAQERFDEARDAE